jgi:hypothetical protein
MESRGFTPIWNRRPFASERAHSTLAGVAALAMGAFLAGGWVAAIAALFLFRVAQTGLRLASRGGGGLRLV